MRTHLILGALMLTAGVILLITGTQASHSMAEVSNTFYGRFTQGTTWYIFGGIATGLLGLSLLLFGTFGKRA